MAAEMMADMNGRAQRSYRTAARRQSFGRPSTISILQRRRYGALP